MKKQNFESEILKGVEGIGEEIKNEKVKTNKTLIDKKGPKVELSKQMMKSSNNNSKAINVSSFKVSA